jgi:peptide chain release factor 1
VDPAIPQFNIRNEDLKIEWYSGTGAGGQKRNKCQNSCRITHIPTGTIATAQTRDRTNSLKLAMEDITKKVDNILTYCYNSEISKDRKQQVGSGMRGDKIRTYRFQDDRVQDHRSMNEASVKKIMNGNFDLLWK